MGLALEPTASSTTPPPSTLTFSTRMFATRVIPSGGGWGWGSGLYLTAISTCTAMPAATSKSLAVTSSMNPPRPSADLIRRAQATPLPTLQRSTRTPLMPPETSLPTETAPWPALNVQSVMVTSSHARASFRPSSPLPDLMAMQSSCVLNVHFSMRTRRQESGSMPSELWPWVSNVTPTTATSSQNVGCRVHTPYCRSVTP